MGAVASVAVPAASTGIGWDILLGTVGNSGVSSVVASSFPGVVA